MLSSYSSPYNLGHRALEQLFNGTVYVSEKIDGSQFSFGVRDGQLFMRSRKKDITNNIPQMFAKAAQTVQALFLNGKLEEGWTYRGEVLNKPKHNTLKYDRVPTGNVIIYDVDISDQAYAFPDELSGVAEYLGLECVPHISTVEHRNPTEDELNKWLDRESILGGCQVEGLVFKNYFQFDTNKKVLMGKLVSVEFREKHNTDWKRRNPNRADVVDQIIRDFGSEARWHKAIQHLQEQALLSGEPKDIGLLMQELVADFETECAEEIGQILWLHFRKQILRGVTNGFPEFYKNFIRGDTQIFDQK